MTLWHFCSCDRLQEPLCVLGKDRRAGMPALQLHWLIQTMWLQSTKLLPSLTSAGFCTCFWLSTAPAHLNQPEMSCPLSLLPRAVYLQFC